MPTEIPNWPLFLIPAGFTAPAETLNVAEFVTAPSAEVPVLEKVIVPALFVTGGAP